MATYNDNYICFVATEDGVRNVLLTMLANYSPAALRLSSQGYEKEIDSYNFNPVPSLDAISKAIADTSDTPLTLLTMNPQCYYSMDGDYDFWKPERIPNTDFFRLEMYFCTGNGVANRELGEFAEDLPDGRYGIAACFRDEGDTDSANFQIGNTIDYGEYVYGSDVDPDYRLYEDDEGVWGNKNIKALYAQIRERVAEDPDSMQSRALNLLIDSTSDWF